MSHIGSYMSSAVDQGLRRTAQMNAETLLITAARAMSKGGSRTNISGDSEAPNVPYLFPICNRNFPTGSGELGAWRAARPFSYPNTP